MRRGGEQRAISAHWETMAKHSRSLGKLRLLSFPDGWGNHKDVQEFFMMKKTFLPKKLSQSAVSVLCNDPPSTSTQRPAGGGNGVSQ